MRAKPAKGGSPDLALGEIKGGQMNLIGRVLAADPPTNIIDNISPFKPIEDNSDISGMVYKGISIFLWIAAVLAVIYLIYGGVLYITAGGDAEKATKGRTALINAIIGIIIIVPIIRFIVIDIDLK